MSRDTDDAAAAHTANGEDAQAQLQRMIEQGRSFSSHERNCCFLNTGGPRFADVSATTGLDLPDDGRALVQTDWDQDGDLDLWHSSRDAPRLKFMRNDTPGVGGFLSLSLQGTGRSPRDAIGAKVELLSPDLGGERLIRTLRAGEGFLSQSSKRLHFGLAGLSSISAVRVRWPSGDTEEFTGLAPNRRYRIVQGSGAAEEIAIPARELALSPAPQDLPKQSASARVGLFATLPMPKRVLYDGFDGEPHELPLRSGKPLLVCLWASWCAPCVEELTEFVARKADIEAAGIEVAALSVDGLGDDGSTPAAAAEMMARLEFPFPSGRARPEFVQLMQGYHNLQVALTRPLPIPTSFLIDGEGRLVALYKGPVSIDVLLADAAASPATSEDRIEWAACLPGRSIRRASVTKTYTDLESRTLFELAQANDNAGQLEDAMDIYRTVLAREPNFTAGRRKLAFALDKLKDAAGSIDEFRRAIALDPTNAALYYYLANVYKADQQFAEALAAYDRAIELKPDYKEAHVNAGAVLIQLERLDEAALHFRRALEIDPNFTAARQNLLAVEAALNEGR